MPQSSSAPVSALDILDETQKAEFWACLALRHARGIGARTASKLIHHFGSAYAAVLNPRQWAEAELGHKAAAIMEQGWRERAMPEWEAAHHLDARIILYTDPAYPAFLRELPDAPLLLYARGDISLLSQACIAIVGTRHATQEGNKVACRMGADFAHAGLTVVSGMARGIDAEAHKGALTGIGSSIAVLGCGVDVIYPPEHAALYNELASKGLLVSEFAPHTAPQPSLFPIRNRIISGLSLGVVIVEAALKSGSLITARAALEQNRTVYAVPGAATSPLSSGCRHLVRQGAKVAFSAADIVEDLFPQLQAVLASDYADQTTDPEAPEADPATDLATGPATDLATGPATALTNASAGTPDKTGNAGKTGITPSSHTPFSLAAPIAAPPLWEKKEREKAMERVLALFPNSSPQAEVVSILLEHGPQNVEILIDRLAGGGKQTAHPAEPSVEAGDLSALLVILETLGFVERMPAMVYRACV